MKSTTLMLAVSMLATIFIVNGAAKDLPSVNHGGKSDRPAIWKDAANILSRSGEDGVLNDPVAKFLEIEDNSPERSDDVYEKRNGTDLEGASCALLYPKKQSTDNQQPHQPSHFLLYRARRKKDNQVDYYFRVSLDGKLEKAVCANIHFDSEGKVIHDDNAVGAVDIDSPEIKAMFSEELTQLKKWLKSKSAKSKK